MDDGNWEQSDVWGRRLQGQWVRRLSLGKKFGKKTKGEEGLGLKFDKSAKQTIQRN